MAAVSFQPITSAAQDAAGQTTGRPASQAGADNATPLAFATDTVNVSSVAVAAAQAGQDAGNQGTEFVFRQPSIFQALTRQGAGGFSPSPIVGQPLSANGGGSAGGDTFTRTATNADTAPVAAQAAANLAGTNSVATAAGAQAAPQTGTTVLTATPQQTQQEQLAQLDRILASLGIDPQSIPEFNQLALLRYLNDPSGLQHFLQQLQSLTPFPPTPSATSPANSTSPSANRVSLQAVGNAAAGSPPSAATSATAPSAAQVSAFTSQFQELQASLEATQPVNAGAASGSPSLPGQALDLRA